MIIGVIELQPSPDFRETDLAYVSGAVAVDAVLLDGLLRGHLFTLGGYGCAIQSEVVRSSESH